MPAAIPPRQPPRRRLAPPLPQPAHRIDVFEPRLALSASPGADLLLEAWGAISGDEWFNPVAGPQVADPFAAPSAAPLAAADPAASYVPPLVEQAAAVRETFGLSGAGQTVAVIDSGIAWDHVALGRGFGPGYRVVGGWDFAEDDANPYDDAPAGFHGTHVAGLIGGQSAALAGIAPGADLAALRVFDDAGAGSLSWVESALQWVYEHRDAFDAPITTVNLSLGALLPEGLTEAVHAQLEDELRQLRDASIVVVAAAGNAFDAAHPDRLSYPAASEHTWAVASLDAEDAAGDRSLSQFSQRSDGILATVGRGVTSAVPDHVLGWDGDIDDYHAASGTSMASPQIAAATVLLREAIQQAGGSATPDQLLDHLRQTADQRIDQATGITYYDVNLRAAIESVLGPSPPDDSPLDDSSAGGDGEGDGASASVVDLGHVDWATAELSPATDLRVTAVRDGLFSVSFESTADRLPLRITTADGQVLWDAPPPESGQIDVAVAANTTLTIAASATDSSSVAPSAVRLANVVGVRDGRLELASGEGDPDVTLDLRNGVVASVGDLRYAFASDEIDSGVIEGGSGADRLRIIGSAAAARLVLDPYADGTLSDAGARFILRNFEDVHFDGGGGDDRVFLYDTRGDDTLRAEPGAATLEGVGFRYDVTAVARVYVHATAGGQDVAFLQDSSQDDVLAVRPQFVSLRGSDFFSAAYGFERVYAYATAGGNDTADLYDSAGDDRMTASAAAAMISGPGYYVQARHFDSVTGHATAGGNDRATLYADADAAGRWHQSSDFVALRASDGAMRGARGFEQVEQYVAGVQIGALAESPGTTDDRTSASELRADALLELAMVLSPAKSTAADFCPPPVRRDELERQLIEAIFADVGSDDE